MTAAVFLQGDAKRLPIADNSVHCVVTSPPYWGLRTYKDNPLQLGLERYPWEYIENLVEVGRELRRVLHPSGTLWVVIGDTYATKAYGTGKAENIGGMTGQLGETYQRQAKNRPANQPNRMPIPGLKAGDLVGVPWMLAFALRADGWWLRNDVIWAKPNPMPGSMRTRCTNAHEEVLVLCKDLEDCYFGGERLFLLGKEGDYYYDQEAIREPYQMAPQRRPDGRVPFSPAQPDGRQKHTFNNMKRDELGVDGGSPNGRNARDVWVVTTKSYKGEHDAVFPPEIPEKCILAGTSEKGCCPECLAPWRRLVEVESAETEHRPDRGLPREADGQRLDRGIDDLTPRSVKTVGWEPTCKCGHEETIPCTVLDPFNGAGTTGIVADRLGRRYIGVDVNLEYLELSERRLAEDREPRGCLSSRDVGKLEKDRVQLGLLGDL